MPSFRPAVLIVPLTVQGAVADTASAVPLPGPGSVPRNHSTAVTAERLSVAVPETDTVAAPFVGFGESDSVATAGTRLVDVQDGRTRRAPVAGCVLAADVQRVRPLGHLSHGGERDVEVDVLRRRGPSTVRRLERDARPDGAEAVDEALGLDDRCSVRRPRSTGCQSGSQRGAPRVWRR